MEKYIINLLAALGHVVEVLDDLKPCGHSGDEETGECDSDCMLCRWEAAMEHAEDVGDRPCYGCGGDGKNAQDEPQTCPECGGTGINK